MGWVMWLVMGLLVGVMILFLGFSYFRDKKKNKVVIYKKIELKNITEKTSKEMSLRISTIAEVNQEKIDEFIPSIGVLTMKEINTISKEMLKDIYKSNLFKKIYLAEDYDPEFADKLKILIDVKSNHWKKKCVEELKFFSELEEGLKKDDNYNEVKQDIIKKVNAKFNKEDLIEDTGLEDNSVLELEQVVSNDNSALEEVKSIGLEEKNEVSTKDVEVEEVKPVITKKTTTKAKPNPIKKAVPKKKPTTTKKVTPKVKSESTK